MKLEHLEKRMDLIRSLDFPEDQIENLRHYVDELWNANSQLNLFSRKMPFEELVDNHIIDCLLTLPHFPKQASCVADFGAGGGLPGILYALRFPKMRFRLYEKSRLKQEFLRHCKQWCPNVDVLGEVPNQLGQVDLVVSRAFKSIAVILDISRNYYQAGGRYFLMKARLEKINEELQEAKGQFKNLRYEIIPLKSPILDVERHVVIINP